MISKNEEIQPAALTTKTQNMEVRNWQFKHWLRAQGYTTCPQGFGMVFICKVVPDF